MKTFWNDVVAWFAREGDIQMNILIRAFLFRIPNTVPHSKINFVVSFTKFFIYRQRLLHQGSLSLIHLLRDLRLRLQVEKYLTTSEGKAGVFRKWRRIYEAIMNTFYRIAEAGIMPWIRQSLQDPTALQPGKMNTSLTWRVPTKLWLYMRGTSHRLNRS